MSGSRSATAAAPARVPLNRRRILQAALGYLDRHGLAALSMHKLGAELGVTGMSLYGHVPNKDALLDGIVETIWSELEPPPAASAGWQDTLRTAAQSLRAAVRRHPHAAPLLAGRPAVPVSALEFVDGYRARLAADGFTEAQAIDALRIITVYALGYSLTQFAWETTGAAPSRAGEDDLARLRRVTAMVPADAPDQLVRLAMSFCGGFDPDADFDFGLELMLAGLATRRNKPKRRGSRG